MGIVNTTNSTKVRHLAVLLARYEADEPHSAMPDMEASQFFPEFTWHQLKSWWHEDHFGDCTNQPQTCMRCWAGEIIHKAQWIASHLEE